MAYKFPDRQTQWGHYSYDTDLDFQHTAVYYDDWDKKVHIALRGELSYQSVVEVGFGSIAKSRKLKYVDAIGQILRKYQGYEVHIAGHSNGALNLAQMLVDGVIDPN